MSESDAGETSKGGDIYEQDGDFIKDIEVNDLKNRYTLTKGPFHKEVNIACCMPAMRVVSKRFLSLSS